MSSKKFPAYSYHISYQINVLTWEVCTIVQIEIVLAILYNQHLYKYECVQLNCMHSYWENMQYCITVVLQSKSSDHFIIEYMLIILWNCFQFQYFTYEYTYAASNMCYHAYICAQFERISIVLKLNGIIEAITCRKCVRWRAHALEWIR